jgi:hypothetical protein
VEYLRVGLKGTNPRKSKWIEGTIPSSSDRLKIVFWRSKSFPMGRCDQGIKFCSKIQSARNHFKSNESVGLVVTNPTQLVWVQTDVGRERYRVLFKMTNKQKRGVDCIVRTDADVTGHTTRGRQLFAQLVGDMACL